MGNMLEVKDLHVSFDVYGGEVQAIRGVDFSVKEGESVAIVGESGSGKSVTAQTIMRLIEQPPGKIKSGQVMFQGRDLLRLSEKEMQQVRGNRIGMIFQDPMTSLNPTMTVGKQIMEGLTQHQRMSGSAAKARATELLKMVGIPQPETRLKQYPHHFSGGMRQRVMIAIALACNPALLIADEPTTALDVTIQKQILELMKDLQRQTNTSIILITHDLGIVADMCDRIFVMYAGQIVETGTKREIFYNPQHPYTRGLLNSLPRLDQDRSQPLIPIVGTPPDLIRPPQGCAFYDRCPAAMQVCRLHNPEIIALSETHQVRCWLQHPFANSSVDSQQRQDGKGGSVS